MVQSVAGFHNRRRLYAGLGYVTPEQVPGIFQAAACLARSTWPPPPCRAPLAERTSAAPRCRAAHPARDQVACRPSRGRAIVQHRPLPNRRQGPVRRLPCLGPILPDGWGVSRPEAVHGRIDLRGKGARRIMHVEGMLHDASLACLWRGCQTRASQYSLPVSPNTGQPKVGEVSICARFAVRHVTCACSSR